MKKILMLLFVLGSLHAQSQADTTTSHYKAAVDYILALNAEQNTNEAIDQMVEMQSKNNPAMESKKAELKKFMMKYISWKELRSDYLKIYMEEFSENDLKDMAAFYRTPTGKKVAEKQNVIMMKTSELGQAKMQANMAELMQLMQ